MVEADDDTLDLPAAAWRKALAAAADAGDERPTWAYPWPAGERLAAELQDLLDCRGACICDLGCGRGGLGLRALQLGAAAVIFADASPHPLGWITAALAAKGWQERGRTLLHRWGEPLPPCDWVLGGDILYRPECFEELMRSLGSAAAAGSGILLSDPRRQLEDELPRLAAAHDLVWSSERRPAGYTLVRCDRILSRRSRSG